MQKKLTSSNQNIINTPTTKNPILKHSSDTCTLDVNSNNFNNKKIIYTHKQLLYMKQKDLRRLATKFNINLTNIRKKNHVVSIMSSFFLALKLKNTTIPFLSVKYQIITDTHNNINVSLLFRKKKKLLNRLLGSMKFKELISFHSNRTQDDKKRIMYRRGEDLFLNPILTIHLSLYLNSSFYYELLSHFYLNIEKKKILWVNFRISYGYY